MVQRIKSRNSQYLVIALFVLFFMVVVRYISHALSDDPEIALILGEPWEDMRERSSAVISPAIPNEIWFAMPTSDARLRFLDPQYGFVTPVARFLAISFINERVSHLRMSPQVEPLLLDDALLIVLDLQNQWRRQGWFLSKPKSEPPFADTADWRAKLRDINKGGRTFWQASSKYQVMLILKRFEDKKRPSEERYMITLALAEPWIQGDEE